MSVCASETRLADQQPSSWTSRSTTTKPSGDHPCNSTVAAQGTTTGRGRSAPPRGGPAAQASGSPSELRPGLGPGRPEPAPNAEAGAAWSCRPKSVLAGIACHRPTPRGQSPRPPLRMSQPRGICDRWAIDTSERDGMGHECVSSSRIGAIDGKQDPAFTNGSEDDLAGIGRHVPSR